MIEVEVKAWIKDLNDVKRRLKVLGAQKIGTEHQEDIYFNAPHRDFSITDEALRIRKIPQDGDKTIFITYKGAKMDKISKTRKEIEFRIEDAKKAALILENLGFSPVATIKKERITYLLDEFIISLDNVYNVGEFMEIEKETKEGENFEDSLNKIFEIYKRLGITGGFERRSYLEMLGIY